MTLRDAIDQYTAWRQAHGMKFRGSAEVLYLFLKSNDGEIDCDAVTSAQVCTFLTGNRPLSGYRAKKFAALAGKAFSHFVWGISDRGHEIVGPCFNPAATKVGNDVATKANLVSVGTTLLDTRRCRAGPVMRSLTFVCAGGPLIPHSDT